MERRILLKLIAAGVVAPQIEAASRTVVSIAPLQAAGVYKPEFLSADQLQALEILTELIIPEDEQSGGAKAARVNRYIDVMLADGPDTTKRVWRQGLEEVGQEAQARFGKAFLACSAQQHGAVMAEMAANEGEPETELQRFFEPLKRMTIDGYYTSKIGIHDDMRYQGNTALSEFPGCTHPEHQA